MYGRYPGRRAKQDRKNLSYFPASSAIVNDAVGSSRAQNGHTITHSFPSGVFGIDLARTTPLLAANPDIAPLTVSRGPRVVVNDLNNVAPYALAIVDPGGATAIAALRAAAYIRGSRRIGFDPRQRSRSSKGPAAAATQNRHHIHHG